MCVRKFDGKDWLDESQETVFDQIPLIPLYANYKIYDNKLIYHGIVEKLMDQQRVLNYSVSREIEESALAPRQKYLMTTDQAAGHEDKLETLNVNIDPVLFYNHRRPATAFSNRRCASESGSEASVRQHASYDRANCGYVCGVARRQSRAAKWNRNPKTTRQGRHWNNQILQRAKR